MTPGSAFKLAASVAAVLLASCGSGGSGPDIVRYGHPELTVVGKPSSEPYSSGYLLGQQVPVGEAIRLTHLAVNATEAGPSVILALYSDSAGQPLSLLASTPPTALEVGGNEVAVTTPVDLPADIYWLMAKYNLDATIANDSSVDANIAYVSNLFSEALPDPISSPLFYSGPNTGLYLAGSR
jgi:hypothetical protein